MRRRKLLIGLVSAGAFTAGFGAAVFPASAQLRTITVTLLGGQTVTVQVDAPADTPDDQIPLPGVSTPVTTAAPAVPPAAPPPPPAGPPAPPPTNPRPAAAPAGPGPGPAPAPAPAPEAPAAAAPA